MRWSSLVVLFLLGCTTSPPATLGEACTSEQVGRCDVDGTRLLQCTDGGFQIYADCHGPAGCMVSKDTANCDTSGNSVGARCAPTSEGKVRCDPDGGVNILRCIDGGLNVIFECPAPSLCGIDDAGLTCL